MPIDMNGKLENLKQDDGHHGLGRRVHGVGVGRVVPGGGIEMKESKDLRKT